jgi:cytochrome c-type protein NapB
MNTTVKRVRRVTGATVFFLFGTLLLTCPALFAQTDDPGDYDHQGQKAFRSFDATPEIYMAASSSGRTLAGFYALRQYPGSPPRIPHEVDLSFSGDETDCLSCHAKGGYSQEFGKFAPVTPHPENSLCYQCHVQVKTEELFVESDWKSIDPPRLGRSFLSSSPPPIPHSLQLRENCLSCHTGPGAVAEIRVEHSARGNCRQCHVPALQTAPLKEFDREL